MRAGRVRIAAEFAEEHGRTESALRVGRAGLSARPC